MGFAASVESKGQSVSFGRSQNIQTPMKISLKKIIFF